MLAIPLRLCSDCADSRGKVQIVRLVLHFSNGLVPFFNFATSQVAMSRMISFTLLGPGAVQKRCMHVAATTLLTPLFPVSRRGLPAQSGSSLFPDGTHPDAARRSAALARRALPPLRDDPVRNTGSPDRAGIPL